MRFADPKLQLAMIDEIYRRRSEYAWVASHRSGYEAQSPTMSWSDLEANMGDHAAELEKFLGELPITYDDLQRVDSLTLDGDRDLYGWCYPSWWDFGNHFTIRDLHGIEECTRLRYLLLGQGLVEGASLKPVSRLPSLRELHLCARCQLQDIPSLLDSPSLRTLDVVNTETSDQRMTWLSTIEELRALGVTVEAH